MKSQVRNIVMYLFVFLLFPIICFGQDDGLPESPDGSEDPLTDPAPINESIWILMIFALILGWYLLLKKQNFSRIKV